MQEPHLRYFTGEALRCQPYNAQGRSGEEDILGNYADTRVDSYTVVAADCTALPRETVACINKHQDMRWSCVRMAVCIDEPAGSRGLVGGPICYNSLAYFASSSAGAAEIRWKRPPPVRDVQRQNYETVRLAHIAQPLSSTSPAIPVIVRTVIKVALVSSHPPRTLNSGPPFYVYRPSSSLNATMRPRPRLRRSTHGFKELGNFPASTCSSHAAACKR